MNPILSKIGRRLRVGVVGGGRLSLIGPTHRVAMRFDDVFEIVAGCLSGDPVRSLRDGEALGISRPYTSLVEMLASERTRQDRIDIVAIMTPNDNHYPSCVAALEAGFHVICDKPLANSADEVRSIVRLAKATDRLVCVTHNYSGYPMVRQMRSMVQAGSIGRVHLVNVRYAQGNLGVPLSEDEIDRSPQLKWRLNPSRGGKSNLLLDVGSHAHQLASFVTNLDFKSVFADIGSAVPGRTFEDTAAITARLENGARASIQVTKAATGAPQIFEIEAFGDKGGLMWEQQESQLLAFVRPGKPTKIFHRGVDDLDDSVGASIRTPRPHPEGFREAFANIYLDFGKAVAAHLKCSNPGLPLFPDAAYGLKSLQFIEACMRSNDHRSWIDIEV
jgi:predicted dehydrogenase